MDHKLRVFCKVAETRSFSKASEVIHLTQPAVSIQIQALEEKYGTKLFDRTSNMVTLTPAGEVLYKYAKEILALHAAAERIIGEITGVVKGGLTIGACSTIGDYLLPSIIKDFRKVYPMIKIHLLIGNTSRVVDLLDSGSIDVGLVTGEVTRQKMNVEKLISDELLLAVSSDHRWASRTEISVSELKEEPFILREAGSGTRDAIEAFLAKFGISLRDMKICMVFGSIEAIKEAIENGLGVSIMSPWVVKKEIRQGTLQLLNFKEGKLERNFSLVTNKYLTTSSVLDEFLSFLKSYQFDKLPSWQRRNHLSSS